MRRRMLFAPLALPALAGCPNVGDAPAAPKLEPSPIRSLAPLAAPIGAQRLVGHFPQEVGDWTLALVVGGEHPLRKNVITSASGEYHRKRDDGEQRISVVLVDGVGDPEAYASFDVAWRTVLSNPLLAYAHLDLGGSPGVERTSSHPLTVEIQLLVARRFLVQAGAENVEAKDVRQFLKSFPIDRIAEHR
jgi:hypothetical protein